MRWPKLCNTPLGKGKRGPAELQPRMVIPISSVAYAVLVATQPFSLPERIVLAVFEIAIQNFRGKAIFLRAHRPHRCEVEFSAGDSEYEVVPHSDFDCTRNQSAKSDFFFTLAYTRSPSTNLALAWSGAADARCRPRMPGDRQLRTIMSDHSARNRGAQVSIPPPHDAAVFSA